MSSVPFVENTLRYRVQGGYPLRGTLQTEGAKNAALPLLAASLLTDEPVELHNVPPIEDVRTMQAMLTQLGKEVGVSGGVTRVRARGELQPQAPYELVRRMRASFIVLGPLLARLGSAQVPLPGGCVLGPRPVDYHLKGLRALGAEVTLHEGSVQARAKRLHGAALYFDVPSVGATQHLMMGAALVPERTVLYNPAQEPEVHELVALLQKMGAEISVYPDRFEVRGKCTLHGATHRVMPDRLNAGTYLIAGAISRGEVNVACVPGHLDALLVKLREVGFAVEQTATHVRLKTASNLRGVQLETRTYPGFANDLQPQMMALLSQVDGDSLIRETVFAERFGQVPELVRLGAHIDVNANTAFIKGVPQLEGTEVHATDIRSGAALVLAGLAARGETTVVDRGHTVRGYADLAGKLRQLGAHIHTEVLE